MARFWEELVQSRAVWLSVLADGAEFAGCPSLQADYKQVVRRPQFSPLCEVTLKYSFPRHYFIHLKIDIYHKQHRLELHHKELGEPLLLSDGDGFQMSPLWRWEEFQTVIRHLDREALAPAWAHRLLFGIAGTPPAADHEAFLIMVQACLHESQLFTQNEIEHILGSSCLAAHPDSHWSHDPALGWVVQDELSTSRRHRDLDFNFPRFNDFLAGVTRQT